MNAATETAPTRVVQPIFWSDYNSILDTRSNREITPISGKARRVALLAYLATLPAELTFQQVRVVAFEWRRLNPRGKRSGWIAPTVAS